MNEQLQQATLGGGCFWCLEAVFREVDGVERVISGYAGGQVRNPSYREVCTGRTGHAEVVRVEYDPEAVDYETLLEIFFSIHDPTQKDRQGNDIGTQYRSVIFYHDDSQAETARRVMARLTDERVFDRPIVTELAPDPGFYAAEDYHQDYFPNNAGQPYCQIVIAPKLARFRERFAARRRAADRPGG
jgi:peptide-methionine (S)-S-oxide reductase